MLVEIIILIFLCRNIDKIAISKGLKPQTWKILTIVAWFTFELAGGIIGLLVFDYNDKILTLLLFAWLAGFGGYLLIRYLLEKEPDRLDDDINRVKVRDLRP